ncbi:MAG: hypothetical protein IH855_02775 [Bacteroidetes bacterium]|nr:hypothetical protein [Bacteroidota bacterium]
MTDLQYDGPVYQLSPEGLAKLRDVFDSAKNGLRETFYRWDNGLFRQDITLPEHYIENRIAVVCYLESLRPPRDLYTVIFFARQRDEANGRIDDIGNCCFGILECDAIDADEANDGRKRNMLVLDVQVVDGIQKVIPTVVRLYRVEDEVSNVLADGLYWSVIQGRFKTIPVPVKRETRILGWPPSEVTYEFVPHNIEGGLEIMEYVAHDRAEVMGKRSGSDIERIAVRILVKLNGRTPSVQVRADSLFKLRDVLIGPFDL